LVVPPIIGKVSFSCRSRYFSFICLHYSIVATTVCLHVIGARITRLENTIKTISLNAVPVTESTIRVQTYTCPPD
jgi:hypothetical protein